MSMFQDDVPAAADDCQASEPTIAALGAAALPDSAFAERLPVPPNLIALNSEQGHQLLVSANASSAYFPLSEQFTAQINRTFCGVASAVMVLNALQMQAPRSAELEAFSSFDQQNVFNDKTETAVPRRAVEQRGMSLDELGAFIAAHGLKTEVHHAADVDIHAFRREAVAHLGAPDHYILVNFLRPVLNQAGGGHISPLAAYNAMADRLLLLDVSRYKYPPVWVATQELFAAMNTRVPQNMNRSRGCVGVSR
jgi:hypothetical protein